MSSVTRGTIDATKADDHFVDECGDRWYVVADDMRGHFAVDREDGCKAGEIAAMPDGTYEIYDSREGETFDVNNPAEFIVANDQWERNEA